MTASLVVRVAPGDVAGLEARARDLSNPAGSGTAERWALVRFTLGGAPYAVELALLECVVTRLGTAGPLAGAPAGIRGLAFVDSVPHVAVDLVHRTSGVERELAALSQAPALVLRSEESASAVCVEGPLELVDAPRPASPSLAEGPVAGRLADGTLVLSSQWLLSWVASLGEGR
ncbi:MAG: hypothetical protein Q8L48_06160 [Archangium sp.]|nr:hypothetical protein [Archangium sp.]